MTISDSIRTGCSFIDLDSFFSDIQDFVVDYFLFESSLILGHFSLLE